MYQSLKSDGKEGRIERRKKKRKVGGRQE